MKCIGAGNGVQLGQYELETEATELCVSDKIESDPRLASLCVVEELVEEMGKGFLRFGS